MINFILYEDAKPMREHYKNVIFKIFGSINNSYKIIEIDKYDQESKNKLMNIEGNKVYLLDIEVPGKNGLDLAREIRNEGDWDSQIIMITSHEQYSRAGYTSRLLMLDFISKYSDIESELRSTLDVAMDIFSKHKSLSFDWNGDLFQIPYSQILYIEKSLNDNNCKVITAEKEYLTRDTIQNLEKTLCEEPRFMKTHRSCIVNLNNISKVDFSNNIIYFNDKCVSLISRMKKRELKERL